MTDLNLTATVTGYTNGVGAAPASPGNVNDNNSTTYSNLTSGGAGGAHPVRGWESDLGSSQWAGSFTFKELPINGPWLDDVIGGTQGTGSYGSRLQYWNGSSWINIPGSVTSDHDVNGNWTFTFTSVIFARKWRVEMGGKQSNNIWGGTNLYTWAINSATAPTIQASFTATPVAGSAPLEVEFTDTSTGSPDTWSWDFGDGQSSIEQNPTHTYEEEGAYTVSLYVSNQP